MQKPPLMMKISGINTRSHWLMALGIVTSVTFISMKRPVADDKVPGTVIDHIASSTGTYIGSPSVCILPDGDYVASHDYFGPSSSEHSRALTSVFRSSDRGKTWKKTADINGQFWSNLFVHNKALYIMGPWKHHGNLVIRRSEDGGSTWTEPSGSTSGLLRQGEYHTAPVPMVLHNGRIWRAVEYAKSFTEEWGKRYSAMMFSAPVDANLLDSASWTSSNYLPWDSTYLGGRFRAWLEGNVVVAPNGEIVDFLRIAVSEKGRDMAALVKVSRDGTRASFDPSTGFLDFAGGARKFTIRFDKESGLYWAITNIAGKEFSDVDAGSVRNTLVIKSSPDLIHWKLNKILLHHPDIKRHGFQYVDWQFDNRDIIFVSRTAFDDEFGGAHNYHDANFMTFHRIKNFRKLKDHTIEGNQ